MAAPSTLPIRELGLPAIGGVPPAFLPNGVAVDASGAIYVTGDVGNVLSAPCAATPPRPAPRGRTLRCSTTGGLPSVSACVLAPRGRPDDARWIAYGGAGAGIMGLGFLGGTDSGARFAPHVSGIGGVELVLADTRVFLEARGELVLPIGDPMFGFLAGRIGVKFPLATSVATEP